MKKGLFIILLLSILVGCFKPKKADLVIYNAKIHTLDDVNSTFQAMAVKDGKIIEFGPERQILNKYRSDSDYDAGGHDIYPGFTDAHTHLLLCAQGKLAADLKNISSTEKLIITLEKYSSRNNLGFIIGNGLKAKNMQERIEIANFLNQKFPNTPVFIITNDAHNAILNDKAISYLQTQKGIQHIEISNNGSIEEENFFRLLPLFPTFPKDKIKEALFEVQDEFLQFGIIAVHEMGWSKEDYTFFKSFTKNNDWKMNISAYMLPTKENLSFLKNGKIITDKIQVNGIKIFLDGTFGSKSAAMLSTYKDGTSGKLNYSDAELDSLLLFAYKHNLQVAVHAAGDKAVTQFIDRIETLNLDVNNDSWRIEHIQKINPDLIQKIAKLHIIPSIQPYHAISDMTWLPESISVDNTFYAYQSLFSANNIVAIGSDMPIERYNPFQIIWAASSRKDVDNPEKEGFNLLEKMSIQDLIKSYSLYNAQIVGRETKTGTLEIGKEATFFSTYQSIDKSYSSVNNYALKTFIKGKEVYSLE